MKKFLFYLSVIYTIVLFFTIVSCNSQMNPSDNSENNVSTKSYYIIGYDVSSGVNIENNTGKAGGYLFVSENLKVTLGAYNVPDNLFTFPAAIMPTNWCGFNFFPQEYRFTYKVQMTYRLMTKEEQQEVLKPCIDFYPAWGTTPTLIFIKSISKE